MKIRTKPPKATRLLNETPFDGCLLVFNASPSAFRARASSFNKRYGFAFSVNALAYLPRDKAHDPATRCDLYITLK